MKKFFFLSIFILISSVALAAVGTGYRSNPENTVSAGGTANGSAYSTGNALGDNAIGNAAGATYSTNLGIIASSISYAAREAGVPFINNLKFDGRSIHSGDYVSSNAVITAIVTDTASSINTTACSLEIDATSIPFSSLSGNSSYDPQTGNLTYKNATPFANGLHSFKIVATNSAGIVTTLSLNFIVESGETKVSGPVLNYPNPFSPDGVKTTIIAYNLNADAKVTVYLINSIGQIIWKRESAAGAEGGHSGYNAITWNGYSDFGEIVSNDMYLMRVVSDGKVIGKGKLAILR